MEREIVFRGKRIDDGEWVEGDLYTFNKFMIRQHDHYYEFEVDKETVGQYTGLKDKNKKRIFEGDILEFEDLGEEGYEYKEGFDFINTASVVFNNGRFELENFGSNNSGVLEEMNDNHEDFISIFAYSKIIGNIHDNPELLEVQ